MAPTPRILLIEDDPNVIKAVTDTYGGAYAITISTNPEDAEVVAITVANTFELVVLDACLGGNSPNTLRLPETLRARGYRGSILGTSADSNNLLSLKGAGCDPVCHKAELIRNIDKLLGGKTVSGPPAST